MRILVVGCGNIGSVAAKDLARSLPSADIVVADKNEERAKNVAENIGTDNVSHVRLDIENHQELLSTLKDFTLVLGFLPGGFGYRLVKACIDARRDVVDVSFMGENLLKLAQEAAEAGVTIVPDCGLAPGISNLLVGHAAEGLDQVKAVHIFVGGLPEKPLPPLGYVVTWSPESLIDEYTRKAKIITKGRKTEVEALSGLETIKFPSFGKVEAFYTDGLRTLLHTIHVTEEMWEKTLRYPGHAEKIKVLKDLGFFDTTQVDVEGTSMSPRKLTATLLEQKLHKPSVKDVVALKVEVSGIKNRKQTTYLYHLLDFYDEKQKITAMARTTAYTASIAAQLILEKAIKNSGLVPVEKIGADPETFKKIIGQLQKRLVKVTEEITRD
jgi:saccharopine dehydrogenase-like NADP-dependent oxidoreductase